MFKLTTTATAQIPSGFAMPACGHASFRATGLPMTAGVVVRGRQEDSVLCAAIDGKSVAVRTTAYIPGTTAWRPPTC